MQPEKFETVTSGTFSTSAIRLKSAVRASAVHFFVSVLVAVCTAGLVFFLWYPWPFYEIVRGRELFWLVISVDVVCGPLLTMVLWNPSKPRRELALDMGLILLIQITALGYGLYSVTQARPVRLVFEVDRFRLISASEVEPQDLPSAVPHLRSLPWAGPSLIGIRESRSGEETLRSIELSMAGQEPSMRPNWWQSYDDSRFAVQRRMKPLVGLRAEKLPEAQAAIDGAVEKAGVPIGQIHYLPLVSHKSLDQWIALLDAEANIIGYAPVGGF